MTLIKRKSLTPWLAGIAALAMLAGCKPSEKTYREAYETAVSGRKAAESEYLDSATQARMQVMGRPQAFPVGPDMLLCHADVVSVAQGAGLPEAVLGPLYVITGAFKQVFNAKELLKRTQASGFTSGIVLTSRDRRYLVAIPAGTSPAAALDTLHHVQATPALGLRAPYPWVLRVTNSRVNMEK